MKTIIALLTAILLCGCSEQKPDPRIAELQTSLADLRQHVGELREQQDKDFAAYTNHLNQMVTLFTKAQKQMEVVQSGMQQLLAMTNSPIPVVQKVARAVNPNQTKNGVPITVYNQIASDAAKQWPNNYEMQEFQIKNQIESWTKLNR